MRGEFTHRRRRHTLRNIIDFLGGTLLIVGLVLGVQMTWAIGASSLDTSSVSRELEKASTIKIKTANKDKVAQLRTDTPPVEIEPQRGELFAFIHVPQLGKDWKRAIQEGITDDVLANLGAGHYENTAMPGGVGNSSYAGHATEGDFGALYDLRPNDEIIIETSENWYVYKLTDQSVVTDQDAWVINPDAAGVERGLTLTTCYPRFNSDNRRMIWHGRFVGWAPKSDGVPESLAGETTKVSERLKRSVETVSKQVNMPVTGVVALCELVAWLAVNLFNWLFSWRRMVEIMKHPSFNPLQWLWRLQAGLFPSHRIVFTLFRIVPLVLFVTCCVFASWRWLCPWLAANVPGLATPSPSVG